LNSKKAAGLILGINYIGSLNLISRVMKGSSTVISKEIKMMGVD